jgi:hypothetical protein
VEKPVSRFQLENPREFQINQLRRRFHPDERSDEEGTHLFFTIIPSDPDFSYDLSCLHCVMHIPLTYPASGKPALEITNKSLDARYKILVEQTFESLVDKSLTTDGSGTLLAWMNGLDKQLERVFASKPIEGDHPSKINDTLNEATESSALCESLLRPPLGRRGLIGQEKQDAPQRRQKEIGQLTARLGRSSLFSTSSDGVSFTIPISPLKPHLLPGPLQSLRTVRLIIPLSYPLDPCRIKIPEIDDEAARVTEAAFDKHAMENSNVSLMVHLNFLSATMYKMANKSVDESTHLASGIASMLLEDTDTSNVQSAPAVPGPVSASPASAQLDAFAELRERPHIQVIPRPPEWSNPDHFGDREEIDVSDSSYSGGSLTENDEEEDSGGVRVPDIPTSAARGVLLSFPSMELHGIELLELKNLCVTLKCERCKELVDVKNIKIGDQGSSIPPSRSEPCKKCANYLSIGRSCGVKPRSFSVRRKKRDVVMCTEQDSVES